MSSSEAAATPAGSGSGNSSKQPRKRKAADDVTSQVSGLPMKRFFRQRAHMNPFAEYLMTYPVTPEEHDWHSFYPSFFPTSSSPRESGAAALPDQKQVEFADIGCGYGGLMMSLSPLFPQNLILGMEIRDKVEEYVDRRIKALRSQNSDKDATEAGSYQNVAVIRSNAMRFLPNFFKKGQLTKMFFLFPDPHFKAKKHKHRIITPQLLAEYAFHLRIGGLLYTCTDVRDLHDWMAKHADAHPLFESVPQQELETDRCVPCVLNETEEGKKVARNKGEKFLAVYRRIQDKAGQTGAEWKGFVSLFEKEVKNGDAKASVKDEEEGDEGVADNDDEE